MQWCRLGVKKKVKYLSWVDAVMASSVTFFKLFELLVGDLGFAALFELSESPIRIFFSTTSPRSPQ